MTAVPLLRSPPFPGIAPAVAAVDAGARDRPFADAEDPSLARALAAARVGGCFWGEQVAPRPRLIVAGADGRLPEGSLADAVVVSRRWPSSRRLRGAAVAPPGADPWPLIEGAQIVVAPPGHELALLAAAAGRPLRYPDGTAAGPAEHERLAAALAGRRYRDPFTGRPLDAAAAIALLASWRALIDANRGIAAAAGMAFWKRREIARLLWDGRRGRLPFARPAAAIVRGRRAGGAVAAWPARVPAAFAARAEAARVPVRWVEDGFLRSAGLGSDLVPPLSLIVDDDWPYFDPARASRLEAILARGVDDPVLLARARALRETIVARRIGKYRLGGEAGDPAASPAGRLVVVVGQVEDDLSILRGGAGMRNLTLIEGARRAERDAYIVYRPHPDVEAGHRRGTVSDAVALGLVDRIDRGGSLDALLTRADALHTITSLAGFEALLRGVRVVTHGGPFYAGWGLTDDRGPPLPRRRRTLLLDELVAGALIVYPRYLHAGTGLPCAPEQFIDGLGGVGGHGRGGWLVRLRRWQGRLRRSMG